MNTIKKSGNDISVEVSVFVYKDSSYPNGRMYIAYCPALDLAGYDTTERGAKKSFEIVMNDYLEDTIAKGSLEEDLFEHGWTKKDGKITEPSYPTMFLSGKLTDILTKTEFKKYTVPVEV